MKYQFLKVEDVKIAYIERNPSSPKTIVFVHSSSMSSRMWQRQLSSSMLKEYRMIAFDLPAHGKSSAPVNPEEDYRDFILYFSKITAKVIEQLVGSHSFIIAGFSLGTNIIAQMLSLNVKPSGIIFISTDIIGGEHSIPKEFQSGAHAEIFFKDRVNRKEVENWFTENMPLLEQKRVLKNATDDFLIVKPPFRSALFNFIRNRNKKDEIELVKNYSWPIFLVFGDQNQAVNIRDFDRIGLPLWRKRVHSISGGYHYINMEQPRILNLLIGNYAYDVFRSGYF